MARIFISYKRVDKDKVFKIRDSIESALGEKCWIDIDGIESDAQFKNIIIHAINECEVVLFMYSRTHSYIQDLESDWTMRELNFATKKNKRIVFVNIDGSSLTDAFEFDYGIKQQVDATSAESLSRLIEDLSRWLSVTTTGQVHVEPVKEASAEFHPFIKLCILFQILLYTIFTLSALWLFMCKPIPYTQFSRVLSAILTLSFAVSLYFTICLYRLKRWAFWAILAMDLVSMILISWISTNMTGLVLTNPLLVQLHGYGRAINYGRGGFFSCVMFLCGVGFHSLVTYLVLQIKYKGRRMWDMMK